MEFSAIPVIMLKTTTRLQSARKLSE
jgi:hypothetical protein